MARNVLLKIFSIALLSVLLISLIAIVPAYAKEKTLPNLKKIAKEELRYASITPKKSENVERALLKLDPDIREKILSARNIDELNTKKMFIVLLKEKSELSVKVLQRIDRGPIHLALVEATYTEILKLAFNENVVMIVENRKVEPPKPRIPDNDVKIDLVVLKKMLKSKQPTQTIPSAPWTTSADKAWAKYGITGRGVKIAIVDTGIDFGHPDFWVDWFTPKVARDPRTGWPMAFDPTGMFYWKLFGIQASGFVNTSFVDVDADNDGILDKTGFKIAGIVSASGEYHLGNLTGWPFMQYWYGIEWNYPVLVVDPDEPHKYTTVYIDFDLNKDFTDERPAVLGSGTEVLIKDYDGDGFPEESLGLLYYISDGVTPVPYSDVAFGDEGIVEPPGNLVAIMVDTGEHGTLCAGAAAGTGFLWMVGTALEAELIPIGNVYLFLWNFITSYFYVVEGPDGIPNTGDEADVASFSFGDSYIVNDGWDYESRLLEWIIKVYEASYGENTVLLASTGNGGPGYGTVTEPGASYGTIGVGASSAFYVFSFDQLLCGPAWCPRDANNTNFMDLAFFNNRGPAATGALGPHIVAVGMWDLGAIPLWTGYYYTVWGGTSLSSPVAAGVAALAIQTYRDLFGDTYTAYDIRDILMSSADDIGYDPLAMGAGMVNASKAVEDIIGMYDPSASPKAIVVKPAFAEFGVVSAGRTYTKVLEVLGNTDGLTVEDYMFKLENVLTYELTANLTYIGGDSVSHYSRPDIAIALPEEVLDYDMVVVKMIIPLEQFDINGDYYAEIAPVLSVHEWVDINGDGVWFNDTNGNGIYDYPEEWQDSEINIIMYDYSESNIQELTVGYPDMKVDKVNGAERRLVVGLADFSAAYYAYYNITMLYNVTIEVQLYKKVDNPHVSAKVQGDSIEVSLNIPRRTKPGLYYAMLKVRNAHGGEATVPVLYNVKAVLTFRGAHFGEKVLTPKVKELYDNEALGADIDWWWRPEVGDWRFFFFEVPERVILKAPTLFAAIDWLNNKSDINVHVLAPVVDEFSQYYSEIMGPYTLEVVAESDWGYIGGGRFMWKTNTNTSMEVITFEPTMPGLYEVLLHNVLFDGSTTAEPFKGEIHYIYSKPRTVELGLPPGEKARRRVRVISTATDIYRAEAYEILINSSTIRVEDLLQDEFRWVATVVVEENAEYLDLIFTNPSIPTADIDMYVYYDADGDGVPSDGDILVGSSLTPTAIEEVLITNPEPGKYFVFAHGYSCPEPVDFDFIYVIRYALPEVPWLTIQPESTKRPTRRYDLRLEITVPEDAEEGDIYRAEIRIFGETYGLLYKIPVVVLVTGEPKVKIIDVEAPESLVLGETLKMLIKLKNIGATGKATLKITRDDTEEVYSRPIYLPSGYERRLRVYLRNVALTPGLHKFTITTDYDTVEVYVYFDYPFGLVKYLYEGKIRLTEPETGSTIRTEGYMEYLPDEAKVVFTVPLENETKIIEFNITWLYYSRGRFRFKAENEKYGLIFGLIYRDGFKAYATGRYLKFYGKYVEE